MIYTILDYTITEQCSHEKCWSSQEEQNGFGLEQCL
ncbi:hypothetical protein T01_9856 [Trichinella spiralis]|uniref:Uncharacterized protein n=1 Tax=Trichinella spiralis TaxID=6334 RepID=A0A0V1AMM9_TRISP|nr:hypothetical protein T01_9856 [Trichinella spiralis]